MPKFNHRVLIISCCTLALWGCASTPKPADPADKKEEIHSLKELKGLAKGKYKAAQNRMNGIRIDALKETALAVGAQGGLAEASLKINEMLTQNATYLDKVYDFNQLIMEHDVLPPVLLEGRTTLNESDEQTLRVADRSYEILKQARFATTPPNWRQYLWMDYKFPEKPDFTLIPKNDEELKVWNKNSDLGWEKGRKQANLIFRDNIARLTQDFVGMVRYRQLLANHMVTPPYVAKTELGVTGGGNSMRVDDRVLRISALPQLVPTSKDWKSNLSKEHHPVINENITAGQKGWNPIIAP